MNDDDWVDRQLALLPVVNREPNTAKALVTLQARERRRRAAQRRWAWAATAAAATCLALLVLPGTRAFAQRLWDRLFLNRVEVVRVSFEGLPPALSLDVLSGGGFEVKVLNADQAERAAGFRPTLPSAGVLSGDPKLSVIPTLDAGMTLHRAELSRALEKASISGFALPPEWDGASLRLQIGPIVDADYGEVSMSQCRPFTLVTPPGFATTRFLEVAFRILGVEERKARRMSERFAANPAWYWGIPREKQVTIQEVSLRSGSGVYVETFDSHGLREDASVIWSTPDRIYLVTGKRMNRRLALAVANSIP